MKAFQKRMQPLLGTFVEIGIEADTAMHPVFQDSFAKIAQVQKKMSFHDPQSELSQLNHHPHQWVELSAETLKVLSLAKDLEQRSKGRFNCTLGGRLVQLGYLPNHFKHPFSDIGSTQALEINTTHAKLHSPMLITLDGIAKGYAVDLAIQNLQSQGIQNGWVNAGGDLRVFGDLSLPITLRGTSGKLINHTTHSLKNQAMASSHLGQTFSQTFPGTILQPDDQPVKRGIISVIASEAWLADGLTKVLGLCHETERHDLAQAYNIRYIWQDAPLTN